ncbi:hypothetical protein L484_002811 [Morus notabilis]|uniref:Uncharacterized protein n=1 Tax=Morus notabilis TaxID=981085 RepID=W9RUZ5_9ROSA|nr:hypothetical protein L484_002811 [Morus notabilis]
MALPLGWSLDPSPKDEVPSLVAMIMMVVATSWMDGRDKRCRIFGRPCYACQISRVSTISRSYSSHYNGHKWESCVWMSAQRR